MRWSRRQFTRRCSLFGLAAVTVGFPMLVRGQAKGRVVVIGGGPGGATCARYLAKQSGEALAVTLIEQQARYTTCFYSNLYLAGWRDFASLVHRLQRPRLHRGAESAGAGRAHRSRGEECGARDRRENRV